MALTQLYEANFDRIFRYIALKIGDRMEAEDLTQQVFLKAVQSIGSYKWKGMPFSAWLYRIAHNQIVDYFRRRSKRPTVTLDETDPPGGDDPERATETKLTMEELARATGKLTAAQREVISLRFGGQLSIAECARTMGKTEGAVKALQHSAVAALRRVMAADSIP